MKTLYLMRHAKAYQERDKYKDFDRPLTSQGIEDTKRIAAQLKTQNVEIKNIVCSPSVRTKETASALASELGIAKNTILMDDSLYDSVDIEDCVFSLPDEWDHALLIGHNPSITQFASQLTTIYESIPTAGVIGVVINIDKWSDLFSVTATPKLNLIP